MPSFVPVATGTASTLSVGTKVCVWNRSLGSWCGRFAVAEIHQVGYRLRRLSDNSVFPDFFAFEDVRQDR